MLDKVDNEDDEVEVEEVVVVEEEEEEGGGGRGGGGIETDEVEVETASVDVSDVEVGVDINRMGDVERTRFVARLIVSKFEIRFVILWGGFFFGVFFSLQAKKKTHTKQQ